MKYEKIDEINSEINNKRDDRWEDLKSRMNIKLFNNINVVTFKKKRVRGAFEKISTRRKISLMVINFASVMNETWIALTKQIRI